MTVVQQVSANEIHGVAVPTFQPVVDAFVSATRGKPGGAALSVLIDGQPVIDVWGGWADHGRTMTWEADTATVVFSCTKGIVSILIARLVQDRLLVLDAPVADYWPQFAQAGKADVTVRQLLAHRAGLAALRQDVDLDEALDWDTMAQALAGQEPLWEPGTTHGYHALTFGWLAGELIRRVTGLTVDAYLAQVIRVPLAADIWVGVPPAVQPRVARLIPDTSPPDTSPADVTIPSSDLVWIQKAMTLGDAFPPALAGDRTGFDNPRVQRAEVPGAGGIATARGLAAAWSATVTSTNGVRLLEDAVTADMTGVQSEGQPVWFVPGPYPRWGTGFMLTSDAREFLTNRSFGHDGAGGQVAFADPVHRVGFSYVTNLLAGAGDDRGASIVRALRAVLEPLTTI